MTVNESTAISELHRTYLINEVNNFAARVASIAADTTSLDNIETATSTLVAGLTSLITNTANIADVELNTNTLTAGLATLVTNTANIADVETNTNTLVAGLTSLIANSVSQSGNSISNISTATTTLVKTGAGSLHAINVNSLGTVASTVKIYDGVDATGTLLATINSLSISGSFTYDTAFTVGLCVVTTGTVAPDVTVVYK